MTARHAQRWGSRGGFSLTETVLLISIIGILGITAAPRFLDASEKDARFFHRETVAALRYARKLAVASHCPVQFDFTAGGFALRQRTGCSTGAFSQPVFDPASGASGYTATTPASISVTTSLDPLEFDALGRILNGAGAATDVSIDVGGIAIVALGESGLVHAP